LFNIVTIGYNISPESLHPLEKTGSKADGAMPSKSPHWQRRAHLPAGMIVLSGSALHAQRDKSQRVPNPEFVMLSPRSCLNFVWAWAINVSLAAAARSLCRSFKSHGLVIKCLRERRWEVKDRLNQENAKPIAEGFNASDFGQQGGSLMRSSPVLPGCSQGFCRCEGGMNIATWVGKSFRIKHQGFDDIELVGSKDESCHKRTSYQMKDSKLDVVLQVVSSSAQTRHTGLHCPFGEIQIRRGNFKALCGCRSFISTFRAKLT
jgi:hypothetical protein